MLPRSSDLDLEPRQFRGSIWCPRVLPLSHECWTTERAGHGLLRWAVQIHHGLCENLLLPS